MGKRKCIVCGEEYEYCFSCWQDNNKPAYLRNFHDKNCNDIFDICTRYNMNLITPKKAKEFLMCCDLDNKNNFNEQIQCDIDNIMSYQEEIMIDKPEIEEVSEFNINNKKNIIINKKEKRNKKINMK